MKNFIKLYFLFLVYLFFFLSCNDKDQFFTKRDIYKIDNYLKNGNSFQKSQIRNFIIFVKTDRMIAKTDIEYVEFLYLEYYKKEFSTFKDYLVSALNNDLVFKSEFFKSFDGELFLFNDSFFKNFKISNFNEFIHKYCYFNGKDLCLRSETLKTKKQVLEFAYYLHLNGYYMENFDLKSQKCTEKIENAINFKLFNLPN